MTNTTTAVRIAMMTTTLDTATMRLLLALAAVAGPETTVVGVAGVVGVVDIASTGVVEAMFSVVAPVVLSDWSVVGDSVSE